MFGNVVLHYKYVLQNKMSRRLAFVLAGGKGTRLKPLTNHRAKPAVPFGGKYRIADFVLSSMVHSGLNEVVVLTQFKKKSLERHIRNAFTRYEGRQQSFYSKSPETGGRGDWYKGTADAIAQNLSVIYDIDPELVAVFGADHVYALDYSLMEQQHRKNSADLTISALKVPISEENFESPKGKRQFKFGVIEIDEHGRIKGFEEKPQKPKSIPGDKTHTLISMGNYTFTKDSLTDALGKDYGIDFGGDVIPGMLNSGMNLFVYEFQDENGNPSYWRDIGDLRAYHAANLDLNSEHPPFDLFKLRDQGREIYTLGDTEPPAIVKTNGTVSSVSEGCRIFGRLENSVISPNVYVGDRSYVEDSIILEKCRIGKDVRIKNTIIDKDNHIPDGMQIGYDLNADKAAGFHVDKKSEIVVVPKAYFKAT